MLASIIGLAIGPAAIAELMQQLAHRVRADRVAHLLKRLGKLDVALGDPQQRSHRVAQRNRLDQAAQILQQRWILGCQAPPPAPGPADPPGRWRWLVEILQPPLDSAARPTDRASAAANRRRPRSSNWSRIVSYRSRIARSSIMPPNMPTISGDQNPHRKHDAKMSQSFLRVSSPRRTSL